MRMRATFWFGALAAGLALALGVRLSPLGANAAEPEASARASTVAASPAAIVSWPIGTSSCSARACHGGLEPTGTLVLNRLVLRNEYTTWLEQDPHARAYEVLRGDWSRAIARNLSTTATTPAHADGRCLACHATPRALAQPRGNVLVQEGVGCEACHGPSEKWLVPHTTTAWDQLKPQQKERQYGMLPTQPLASRAAICASCHVGAPAEPGRGLPARDVSHDLIAAGHPRLTFDFAEYSSRMPHHWIEKEGSRALSFLDTTRLEARGWAVGQIASAQAALRLLEARAGDPARPWPELAEYDCFACHHDLAQPSWRQALGYAGRPPGSPPWGTWSFALLPAALAFPDTKPRAEHTPALDALAALRTMMTQPRPDRAKARHLAHEAALALGRHGGETANIDVPTLRKLIEALLADPAPRDAPGCDHAQATYVAAYSLYQALQRAGPEGKSPQIEAALGALEKATALPDDSNSPRGYMPGKPRAEAGASASGTPKAPKP